MRNIQRGAVLALFLFAGCSEDASETDEEGTAGLISNSEQSTPAEDVLGEENSDADETLSEDGEGTDSADADGNVSEGAEGNGVDVGGDTAVDVSDVTSDVQESDVSDVVEPAPLADLVINEVVVKAADNGPDWIEIYNRGGTTVQLEGWGIRDQLNAHEYLIPAESEIPAGGYFVVWGKGSGMAYEMDFSFNVDAEARLFAPDMETMVDKADWVEGDAPSGTSWGRYPDGVGDFQTLNNPTLGKQNTEPEFGLEADIVEPEGDGEEPEPAPPAKLLINEVLVVEGEGANCWVELYNPSDSEAQVEGWFAKPDILAPLSGLQPLIVEAGGFSLLECNVDFPFVLTEDGAFWLMNEQGVKADKIEWTVADVPVDQSYGRTEDGGDEWTTFAVPSPGATNQQ